MQPSTEKTVKAKISVPTLIETSNGNKSFQKFIRLRELLNLECWGQS